MATNKYLSIIVNISDKIIQKLLSGSSMKRKYLILFTYLIIIGCSKFDHAPSGLAIAKLEYNDNTETVYLANDYGFLIQWLDNQAPNLFIYNKPANSILMTNNFQVFIKELQTFPSGIKIDRIRGCSITEMGMPEDYKNQLQKLIKDKSFYLTDSDDGNFPVCVCETKKSYLVYNCKLLILLKRPLFAYI